MKTVLVGAMLLSALYGAGCVASDGVMRTERKPQQAEPSAKTKQPAPRRAVPMTVERAPSPPVAIPRVPTPVIPAQQPSPPAPSPITSCDAGGCWSGGNRYNGSGGTYLDRNGKLCQSNGGFMQCF